MKYFFQFLFMLCSLVNACDYFACACKFDLLTSCLPLQLCHAFYVSQNIVCWPNLHEFVCWDETKLSFGDHVDLIFSISC